MDFSAKETDKIIGVNESAAPERLRSGQPSTGPAEVKMCSPEEELEPNGRGDAQPMGSAADAEDAGGGFEQCPDVVKPVLERLSLLENQMEEQWNLLRENRRLSEELRRMEKELSGKDVEIEKLRRDLLYRQRLFEKELEDNRRSFQEKCELIERDAAGKAALEREYLEKMMATEQSVWAERLAQEKERYERNLAESQREEGFWSKLMKMMTWS